MPKYKNAVEEIQTIVKRSGEPDGKWVRSAFGLDYNILLIFKAICELKDRMELMNHYNDKRFAELDK